MTGSADGRRITRRRLLGAGSTAAAAGLLACGSGDGRAPAPMSEEPPPPPDVDCATGFFDRHEARTVDALAGRILPGSPDDPGAREAGVVNYIDCLLAAGGFAEPVYRQGPFPAPRDEDDEPITRPGDLGLDDEVLVVSGDPERTAEAGLRDDSIQSSGFGVIPVPKRSFDRYGWQSALDPPDLYRRGLRSLDRYSEVAEGAPFVELDDEAQDRIVGALADDEATGFDVPSAEGFFELVRRHVIEGMFSDPIYGGNRGYAGWRLIGYPGAYRAWTPQELLEEGFRRPPQGIRDLHRFVPGDAHRDEPRLPVAGGGLPDRPGWDRSTAGRP